MTFVDVCFPDVGIKGGMSVELTRNEMTGNFNLK